MRHKLIDHLVGLLRQLVVRQRIQRMSDSLNVLDEDVVARNHDFRRVKLLLLLLQTGRCLQQSCSVLPRCNFRLSIIVQLKIRLQDRLTSLLADPLSWLDAICEPGWLLARVGALGSQSDLLNWFILRDCLAEELPFGRLGRSLLHNFTSFNAWVRHSFRRKQCFIHDLVDCVPSKVLVVEFAILGWENSYKFTPALVFLARFGYDVSEFYLRTSQMRFEGVLLVILRVVLH